MFFVMKVSKLCNLRCTYCYEYDELANKERMPLDSLAFFFESLADHYEKQGWKDEIRFVLHGGEPLLLPDSYLRGFVGLQKELLGARGVRYRNSLQTNLFHIDVKRIRLLEELGLGLGVSIDVFGGQRVTLTGGDSQDKVIDNLQLLFDEGAIDKLAVGLITVLHARNAQNAAQTFRFCDNLGLSYRILPIFSMVDPPERMRALTMDADAVVDTLKRVAKEQLAIEGGGKGITVYPLWNFFLAAIHHISGVPAQTYDPRTREWAAIVNTNGDAYNHAEAYSPEGLMGNIFEQPLADVLASEGRKKNLKLRMLRDEVCATCTYANSCSRIPIVEALPSERTYDARGRLTCSVAKPMIDFFVEQITASPAARALVEEVLENHTAPDATEETLAGLNS